MAAPVEQLLAKAQKHAQGGRADLAAALYREVLARFPANARALAGLRQLEAPISARPNPAGGSLEALAALYQAGRHRDIVQRAAVWTAAHPASPTVHAIVGAAHAALGQPAEAALAFERALTLEPRSAGACYNLATAMQALGRFEEALALYARALALDPGLADAHYNTAIVLRQLDRTDDAIAAYRKTLALRPDSAQAHNNLGNALRDRGHFLAALESCNRALAINPGFAEAHNNAGNALRDLGRPDEAAASYRRALKLKPDYVEARVNLGIALFELGRRGEALASFEQALSLDPRYAPAHNEMGKLFQDLGRLDEALASYGRALDIDPANGEALANLLQQQAQLCLWDTGPGTEAAIARLDALGAFGSPLSMLALEDDPARHLRRAERFAARQYGAVIAAPPPSPARADDRIAIGYFSADFHDHATMHLMARLFELHDKSRFRVVAYSYGQVQDQTTGRLRRSGVDYHDIRALGDEAAARLAHAHGLDIAIDLKGYTKQSRVGIFAFRPAPVAVSYLGYPGTLGAPFIDYIVADATLIPDASRRYYAEQVIRLPGCYQANDDTRPIAATVPRRAECGLPETGFVFCCFDASFKIRPPEFDIWMRLLRAVEGSVLWLLRSNPWVEANLGREAAARGIDPARLVFADRVPLAEHLARHALADLFVDSFNYTAHTTASDALWAGLPLVAKLGEGFAARVSSSLLNTMGLPELVTTSPQAYEQLALDLAADPARLRAIREKLKAGRDTAPLFDSARFTRGIEAAYLAIDDRHRRGLPPTHLDIADP